METSGIGNDATAAFAKAKAQRPVDEAFSDLLANLFARLGRSAEDDAKLDEPFFQAKPVERSAAAERRKDEAPTPEAHREDTDATDDAAAVYVDGAVERRPEPSATATNAPALAAETAGRETAAMPKTKPAAAAPNAAPGTPAAPAAPNGGTGNASAPPPQIQVTVQQAPVHAQSSQKLAADASLALQGGQEVENAEAPAPAIGGPSAQPGAAKGGAAPMQGLQGQNPGQNGTAGQNGQQGFANLAAPMMQPIAAAAAASLAGGTGGFAATLDEASVTGGTTALGGPGATSLNGLNAALRRPTASGASPQLPRLAAMEQIAIHIQKAVAAGKDQVTIQLRPEDLGRIDVKLELGADGQVKAHVRAEKPETLELLQRDARGLERALQDAGLRADTGSLSFGLRGENRGDGQGRAPAFAGAMPQSPDAATETIEPHVAARAMDGRVDLHV